MLYWSGLPEATGYDLIAADVGSLSPLPGRLSLGEVIVLARDTRVTSLLIDGALPSIPAGRAQLFFIQPRVMGEGLGYGTDSAPLPRVPLSCVEGCP